MAVMHVRRVWMLVSQSDVNMPMGVRHPAWGARVVRMLVVRVVHMSVCVLYQLVVLMLMLMALSQMKPNSNCHQEARTHQLNSNGLAEEYHRSDGAQKRRS